MTQITHHTDTIQIGSTTFHVPTWPKTLHTKAALLAMVLEACPHPKELHYVDLGDAHGALALH